MLIGLTDNKEKELLLKNIPNSRLKCKTHTLFTEMTKMAKIDILFMPKMAEEPYPLGLHIPVPTCI